MAQQVTNFGRFYTAIRALNPIGDRDDVKKSIVYQYTNGRTDSLREMSRTEYDKCCEDLERKTGQKDELRKERSATLKLMQKMGVDTTDWNRVNLLCRDTRIIGKDFYYITAEEHRELRRKLRSIERKGGINHKPVELPEPPAQKPRKQVIIIPMGNLGQA
ncbi:hypothetical protein [uncultured Muribaculum sp.]|uniref:hypothetical protein n=1 Tax=uncultured Muribaculum sp. TaxID=1918613 RepID=UPI0026474689|nr:hypothetical protein [uncultured Muribaculum sp.]